MTASKRLDTLIEEIKSDPSKAGAAVAGLLAVASLMGANEEWDSAADYLEWIADAVNRALRDTVAPDISDQDKEALEFWREIADAFGIEHDGEEL